MSAVNSRSQAYAWLFRLSTLMMSLQFRNVAGLPTQSPPPSSTTLSLSATTQTSFPVIWIASAIVECGAPLVRDICSTSFNNTVVPISQASLAKDVRASQSVYSQIITKTVVTTLEEYVTSATCDDGPMTSLLVISTVTSTQLSTIYSAQQFNVTLSSKYATTSVSRRNSRSGAVTKVPYHPWQFHLSVRHEFGWSSCLRLRSVQRRVPEPRSRDKFPY
jgi:hypothetical protein